MVNDILNAISTKLFDTFGSSYHYYVEDIQQGLEKKCFVITALQPTARSKSPVLYDRTVPIVLYYFHDDTLEVKKPMYTMVEQLFESLEYITINDQVIRAEELSWTIVDGVLEFFCTYKFTTQKVVTSVPTMSEIEDVNISHE